MADHAVPDEAKLVAACAEGDRAAWVRFVDGYGTLVLALARRMLLRRTGRAEPADAEEIASGVFLALLAADRRLLRRYRPEFRLSTYLGVITRTEVGRWARRRAPGPSLDAVGGGAAFEDPRAQDPSARLEGLERDAAVRELRQELDRLGDRDRLLLTLRFLDGEDYETIARIVRVSPESVGSLLRRAKDRLARRVPGLGAWVEGRRPAPPGAEDSAR